ncbi:hypothetical protein Ancab_007972 [Ancistrocladus abbreviatus]
MFPHLRIASFHLLCFGLLFHVVVGADPLFHICSSSGNYTANSPYDINLNRLQASLYYQTPWVGFALGSVGSLLDQVNGLALCRGDVNFPDCQTCVAEARAAISKLCPYNRGGSIWYDYCLLKYSNQDFFAQIDNQNKFYMCNVNNASDPVSFELKKTDLLCQLSQQASVDPRLYATGEIQQSINGSMKIYGQVQCTRDLSDGDCKKCLDEAISELPSYCGEKQGGRAVGGSCNVRYEIYSFVNHIVHDSGVVRVFSDSLGHPKLQGQSKMQEEAESPKPNLRSKP